MREGEREGEKGQSDTIDRGEAECCFPSVPCCSASARVVVCFGACISGPRPLQPGCLW